MYDGRVDKMCIGSMWERYVDVFFFFFFFFFFLNASEMQDVMHSIKNF